MPHGISETAAIASETPFIGGTYPRNACGSGVGATPAGMRNRATHGVAPTVVQTSEHEHYFARQGV